MKITWLVLVFVGSVLAGWADSTIDAVNRYAYGANIGWVDYRADATNGAVLGQYICSGYIYSANTGWINLGDGLPTNGIRYQNLIANDFGVNHDGAGNLSGYGWGANIGWIAFESTGAPKINLRTGKLSGSAYSANCGWLGLSNAFAQLQTDTLSPGILDTNGLPVAWELTYFGHQGVNPNADPDSDGMSNYEEYLAGTNPTNTASSLKIVHEAFAPYGTNTGLTWNSVSTRLYFVQKSTSLNSPTWIDSGLGLISSGGVATTAVFTDTNAASRFYRVQAVVPLSP